MSIEQQIIDNLYNSIYLQEVRCNQYITCVKQANSVWNKYPDEKKFLDNLVEKYKNFYKKKASELKIKVLEMKEYNIKSYFTYDSDFYNNLYLTQIQQIDKYITDLESKTLDFIKKNKLTFISKDIDELFPLYLVSPTLLGVEY
jgi:hypothetical protein